EWTFTSFLEVFALSELTTDEAIAPTRGNNWDDNGIWRVLHQQKYDPNNSVIHDCFKSLSGVVYAATDMLQYKPTARQQAEARFLRAWAMYWLFDMYDQVPYRDPGENTVQPARVRKGIEALQYIIDEVTAVEADLPPGPADRANRYAAMALLMKCYLNKAVYVNRVNPPPPDKADLNKVIKFADSIIESGQFTFSENYFDNFSPTNSTDSHENIFTQASSFDGSFAIAGAWLTVLNYAQHGFNGFSTLSDFYNKFDSTDKRRGFAYDYSTSPPNPGRRINVGFLINQQYDLCVDTPLTSSGTNQANPIPVIFTPDVHNTEPGPNIEMPGIRPIKYPPDWLNCDAIVPPPSDAFRNPPSNEFVYLGFSDVLLMKAEAILRGGTPTNAGAYGITPTSIVNAIRTDTSRGALPLASVSLENLLDERGRELWWGNWRRQDMIRFGTFLKPFEEKEYTSDSKYLLFPIPYEQLGVNPYLEQNPGY
ncbi:MAG TPA: RagB/SusD family nutrient uptake outer membrane protein, partial [Parafilimonas sp.]|nr:RagB/SusD family nutrient uptake outer membrane protein [Parafilimonas sp.]